MVETNYLTFIYNIRKFLIKLTGFQVVMVKSFNNIIYLHHQFYKQKIVPDVSVFQTTLMNIMLLINCSITEHYEFVNDQRNVSTLTTGCLVPFLQSLYSKN